MRGSGGFVWFDLCWRSGRKRLAALTPGTNLARRRRARSPAILKLLDLLRRPALRPADQRVGDRAFGEIIELPKLAAQRDVDD
jgi:hypothetical protein